MFEAGWKVDRDLMRVLEEDFVGVTQTKIIEDAVRTERVVESNKGFNKTISGQRAWDALISDRVEIRKHRYECLHHEDQAIPRGLQGMSPKALFQVQPKQVPQEFREVVTTSPTAPYPSGVPLMSTASWEDLRLIDWCRQHDMLESAPKCWLSVLVVPGRMLLRHKDVESGKWMLALRTYTGTMVYGLHVQDVKKGDVQYWFPKRKIEQHAMLPILEPLEWDCVPIEFKSPLAVQIDAGARTHAGACKTLIAATGPQENLLKVSARNAFWKIPKTGLRQLQRYRGTEVAAAADLPTLLLALCADVLGVLSDEEQLRLLRVRMPKVDTMKEFLQSEEAKDLLADDDKKALDEEKESEAAQADKVALASATKGLAQKIKEKNASGIPQPKGKAKPKRGEQPPEQKRQRRYPPCPPLDGELTVAELNALVPETCSFAADSNNARWLLTAYGSKHSRSWNLWGVSGAGLELVKIAWRIAVSEAHEDSCPYPQFGI